MISYIPAIEWSMTGKKGQREDDIFLSLNSDVDVLITSLNDELFTKDVTKFCTVSIPATSDLIT